MDEVTVVAEGLVPAVALTLLEVVPFFGSSQVFVLLRLSCTVDECVWWSVFFIFASFYAVTFAAPVFLRDVSLLSWVVSVASFLVPAVSWVRVGPLPVLAFRRLHPLFPARAGVSGSRLRPSLHGAERIAASYNSAAKDRHLAAGFKWSEFLGRKFSRLVCSVSSGVGRPCLWAVLVGLGVSFLKHPLVLCRPVTARFEERAVCRCVTTEGLPCSFCSCSVFTGSLAALAHQPSSAPCPMMMLTAWRQSQSGNRVEVYFFEVHQEVWTSLRFLHPRSEAFAGVMAAPTRNIVDSPNSADVPEESIVFALGSLKPRASPVTVWAVVDRCFQVPVSLFVTCPHGIYVEVFISTASCRDAVFFAGFTKACEHLHTSDTVSSVMAGNSAM